MTPEVVKNIDADTAGAAKTPLMKDWNGGKANEGILEMPVKEWPEEYEDRLHNHLATPATEKPEPAPAPKDPTTNVVPARPAK